MQTGRHFPIPERPDDVRQLWREARSLSASQVPPWLDADDADEYRHIGSVSLAGLGDADRVAADGEFATLELARLIVDHDRATADLHHLYVRRPEPEPIWSIGLRTGVSPMALVAPADDRPVLTAADVSDVPASSVADPFLLRHGGRWNMFLEVVNWRSWKGEIGLATSDDGLRWSYERIVLAEPCHLSYPHVFEADGHIWMVPESSQLQAVRLYRASRFPYDWDHVADLVSGHPFADATLARHEGRWWMTAETSGGSHDTLRLYHAEHLTGPWQEHPASPVVCGDAAIARPAGRIITADGRLLRPAQNCTVAYGTDVRLREITSLTPTTYAEVPCGDDPIIGSGGVAWRAGGMHHADLHRLDDGTWLAAVDGWRLEDEW